VGRTVKHARNFPDTVTSVAQARHFVAEVLERQSPADTSEAAQLMVSELAANAILHAHTGFSVGVEITSSTVRIDVSDTGPSVPSLQTPDPLRPSGRGLRIIEELSEQWGSVISADAKTVWCMLHFAEPANSQPAWRQHRIVGPHPQGPHSSRHYPGPTRDRPAGSLDSGRIRRVTVRSRFPSC
jgi:anti-sigma regulatory factor (Ser/Thr protein kinase)